MGTPAKHQARIRRSVNIFILILTLTLIIRNVPAWAREQQAQNSKEHKVE
jgi:hypothetical protein